MKIEYFSISLISGDNSLNDINRALECRGIHPDNIVGITQDIGGYRVWYKYQEQTFNPPQDPIFQDAVEKITNGIAKWTREFWSRRTK